KKWASLEEESTASCKNTFMCFVSNESPNTRAGDYNGSKAQRVGRRSVNEMKHMSSLEEKELEEAVRVLPSNLMKRKSTDITTRLRRQSDAKEQMQYSGPEAKNEKSRKGHLGQTQADKSGHLVGLEDCSCDPCNGGVARLDTDKSLPSTKNTKGTS
ncbi:hypothetical protein Ancab_002287, partial [Ancistrocladus abbreviatus]